MKKHDHTDQTHHSPPGACLLKHGIHTAPQRENCNVSFFCPRTKKLFQLSGRLVSLLLIITRMPLSPAVRLSRVPDLIESVISIKLIHTVTLTLTFQPEGSPNIIKIKPQMDFSVKITRKRGITLISSFIC